MTDTDRPVSYPGFHGQSWIGAGELDWLIGRLPPVGTLIEVGTACGVTAAKIATAWPTLQVFCIDPFPDFRMSHVEPNRPTLWRLNQRQNMKLWVGDLESFGAVALSVWADAVLVDGDHVKAFVASDLRHAADMLRPGGTIYAHDYHEPALPDVMAAVDAFCGERGFIPCGDFGTFRALRRA